MELHHLPVWAQPGFCWLLLFPHDSKIAWMMLELLDSDVPTNTRSAWQAADLHG